jgi:hypothetical protein
MHPKKATEEESPAADHKGGKPVPGQAFSDKKRQTSLNARIAVEQISRATTQADYNSRSRLAVQTPGLREKPYPGPGSIFIIPLTRKMIQFYPPPCQP